MQLTASAMVSLGRRLPISIDTNFDPARQSGDHHLRSGGRHRQGSDQGFADYCSVLRVWPSQLLPPASAGRLNPDYQQITEIMSRANSTYEAAMVRLPVRPARAEPSCSLYLCARHGLESEREHAVAGSDVLDPADFGQEYGTSNLDVRHSAAADGDLSGAVEAARHGGAARQRMDALRR